MAATAVVCLSKRRGGGGGGGGSSFSWRLCHVRSAIRLFSTAGDFRGDDVTATSNKLKIFDRDLKRKQGNDMHTHLTFLHTLLVRGVKTKTLQDKTAFLSSQGVYGGVAAWLMRPKDTLVDTVAENLLDRLEDCKKTFPTALCLGGSLEAIRRLIRGRGGIEKLLMMDMSYDMVKLCKDAEKDSPNESIETSFLVGDEEFLPVKESSLDLVISCLGLHWTNDLPGAMIQSRLALKPDGLFLAAILGGETLKELRIACTVAQMEREGGISPRLSPLAQVRDAGNLLTRAGFALPGVDVDEYTVRYKSALELIEHLRAMGETNALLQRNVVLKRETALATAAVYESMFAAEDGTIPATFQVIYMTGWKEHESQQRAKQRGSATISFKDIKKQFGGDKKD